MLNDERILATFLELVRIHGPSGRERAVADYVKTKLSEINPGIEISEDSAGIATGGDCGNIIARVPACGRDVPPLLFAAHMDTVPLSEPVRPAVENGIVRSAGATILGADDRSGVTVLLEGVRALREMELQHGPLELVFTVSEETELAGAKNLDFDSLKSTEGYVFDNSEPFRIVCGAPSKNAVTFKVLGRGGHAAAAQKAINPIVIAARGIAAMPVGAPYEDTTCSVGVIRAGTAVNVIPDVAEVFCEVRSHSEDRLREITKKVVSSVTDAISEAEQPESGGGEPPARVDVEVRRCYSSYRVREDEPALARARAAMKTLGLEPVTHVGQGAQDANVFNLHGVRSVALGAGAYRPHSEDEYLKVEELVQGVELFVALTQIA
ncbi:MAG TPA: M20/M25/M40 family metallo-hydrolase [Candidatus Brocadiia bacterium]|nr:M20/M25/M40 family metallo-hydrolase [Candidatus Brocadiia bacterium]